MSNYRKWLLSEVELWLNQGIIDSEQANKISTLYPYQADTNWGKIVFAGIGSVIFGLGIILVFAYNWQDMHRFTKLGVVLLSVAITHGIGFYYSHDQSAHKKVGESLHLLGTMLFGAGIWLVAQVYHIDEHYPNALFVWALGALLIAWLLPSLSHTILALGLVFLWHWFEVFEFHSRNHFAIWLVLAAILPLAWRLRSRGTVFLTCCLTIFSYSASYIIVADNNEETLFNVMIALSGSMIIGSFLASKSYFPQSQNIIRFVGVSVFAVLLFIFSFSEFDDAFFAQPISQVTTLTWLYYCLPIVLLSTALFFVLARFRHALEDKIDLIEILLVSATCYIAFISAFSSLGLYGIAWIIYSLLFLAYSIVLIYRGTRYLRWQSTTLGGLMLASYTFARFMDLFDSLLWRGMAFLVVGAMLFGIGLYYSRQKQLAEQRGGATND